MKKMTWGKTKKEARRWQSGRLFAVTLVSVLLLIASYPASADTQARFEPSVRVMTRNLYVGADIFAVVNVPIPSLIPIVVAEKYALIAAKRFCGAR